MSRVLETSENLALKDPLNRHEIKLFNIGVSSLCIYDLYGYLEQDRYFNLSVLGVHQLKLPEMPEPSVPVQFFAGSPQLHRLIALLIVFEKPGDDAPGKQVLRCR